MSSKRSVKPIEKKSSFQQVAPEVRGLFLLFLDLLFILSLFNFAYMPASHHWLGFFGHSIGWIAHALFGLGSYVICIFLVWVSWRLLIGKPSEHLKMKTFYITIMVISFCILVSVLEDHFPKTGTFLGHLFYPQQYSHKLRYHLGGAPLHFIYKDIPLINLNHLLNATGTAIVFSGTFLASLLFLTKISLISLLSILRNFFRRKDNNVTKEFLPNEETVTESKQSDFMRYVKLRIPQGPPQLSQDPIPSSAAHQQEFLGIQPETNLTSRPSLSKKEILENQNIPKLQEKEIKSQINFQTKMAPKISVKAIENTVTQTLENKREAALSAQRVHNGDFADYKLPNPSLLTSAKKIDQSNLKKDLRRQAEVLEETLQSFGIEAKVGQINCGPTINSFEVHPSIGVKVQKIKTLGNDIALNMEAKSIRIIAPIPGKAAVGIEVPNPVPQEVGFKDMLLAYQHGTQKFHIPVLLGKAVNGDYVMNDLTKMPHCIIAGATGSGKSVCINTIVMAILLNARPDQIKLLMIDPKKVELTPYTMLPHMLAPVITEPRGACAALNWLVKEMENRYDILKNLGVRNIEAFNNRAINKSLEEALDREIPEKIPYIVGIIDELADLMMVASSDIETPIARIAQMARAVGIHLVLATQRPSREVITGLIKANFPTRISFKVASRVNSQIILDEIGAESLLGNGDMLFLPPGSSQLIRAQGAFIRDEDINATIKFICGQAPPNYIIQSFDSLNPNLEAKANSESNEGNKDSLYLQALDIVRSTGKASTTFLQRKLKIGFPRAGTLMDELEANGIVTPGDGSKARKVLIPHSKSLSSDDEKDLDF